MGYLLKGVHAIVDGQLNANLEAAQAGSVDLRTVYDPKRSFPKVTSLDRSFRLDNHNGES
jgi:hypothetical protein